jgi:predicted molibdopterin-dependent oxidoreductase YjgC
MAGRFQRLGEANRRRISIWVDGEQVHALEGDTLLVALLLSGDRLRRSEFDPSARAGFCLMGACQDCWVRTEAGARLRACSTVVSDGMKLITSSLEKTWAELS